MDLDLVSVYMDKLLHTLFSESDSDSDSEVNNNDPEHSISSDTLTFPEIQGLYVFRQALCAKEQVGTIVHILMVFTSMQV